MKNNFIEDIKNGISIDIAFEKYDIKVLEQALIHMDQSYEKGEPLLSDNDYDIFFELFSNKFPENYLVQNVRLGADEKVKLPKVSHTRPMLSTEKAYSKEQFISWLKKVEKVAVEMNESYSIRITPKLDGIAARLENNVLATRWNSNEGFDVTYVFDRGVIPFDGKYNEEGDGELVMLKSYFDNNLSEDFSHPRNVMTGIVKADNPSERAIKTLSDKACYFVRFDILNSISLNYEELSELDNIYDFLYEELIECSNFDFPIDGFVASVENQHIREEMGHNNHHHNWMIALKTRGEEKQTVVKNIFFQTGRTGRITPVIEIEPVKVSGALISNVTGHNLRLLKQSGIGKGAIVTIIRSGEVIPYITGVIKSSEENVEMTCSSCGEEIIQITNSIYECINKVGCPAQLVNSIVYHFKTLEAKNYGINSVEKIVRSGLVRNLSDVYRLVQTDFEKMGFGPRQSEILFIEKQKIIDTPQNPDILIASLGIRNLGVRASSSLLDEFSFYDLVYGKVTSEEISKVENFGNISSNIIYNGLIESQGVIIDLLNLGITIKEKNIVSSDSYFSGKNLIFSGVMKNGNRKELEEQAYLLGAIIQKSVSKKTDYLIVGDKAGSKLDKAEKLGVKVLTEEAYFDMIKS